MPLANPDTTPDELRSISSCRVDDALTLLDSGRFDGARYLCGYAIELALKARICDTLGWSKYPHSRREFENLNSFKTHNLDVLLHLTGREVEIKRKHFPEWSNINTWDPESRYLPVGSLNHDEVKRFISDARTLIANL